MWNHRGEGVAPAGQSVDERLGNVLEHGEAPGHIAVERGVAEAELALVSRGQHQPAELVGEGHKDVAPNPRLDVLLRSPRLGPGEGLS